MELNFIPAFSLQSTSLSKEQYEELERVLLEAYCQAAVGKGRMRHAKDGEPFEKQQIVEIGTRLRGNPAAGPLFQAVKKIYESGVLSPSKAIQELYGAINYIAAAVLIFENEPASSDELESLEKNPDDCHDADMVDRLHDVPFEISEEGLHGDRGFENDPINCTHTGCCGGDCGGSHNDLPTEPKTCSDAGGSDQAPE